MNRIVIPLVALVALLLPSTAHAAYDVTVSSNPTTGGAWSTFAGMDTFTPSGAGANVQVADLEARLSTKSVTIRTNVGGAQDGTLTVQNAVSVTGAANTLHLLGTDITIAASVNGPGSLLLDANDGSGGTNDRIIVNPGVDLGAYLPTTTHLAALSASADDLYFRSTIYTVGNQDYYGSIWVQGGFSPISSAGNITGHGAITGSAMYAFLGASAASNRRVQFANFNTNGAGFIGVSITAGDIRIGGDIRTNTSTLSGSVTLLADTTIGGSCSNLTTNNGSVTGNFRLSVGCSSWSVGGNVDVRSVNGPSAVANLAGSLPGYTISTDEYTRVRVSGRGSIVADGAITAYSFAQSSSIVSLLTAQLTTIGENSGTSVFDTVTTDGAGTNALAGTLTPTTSFDVNGPTSLAANTTINGNGATVIDSLAGGGFGFTAAPAVTAAELGTVSGTFTTFSVAGAGARLQGAVTASGVITATDGPLTMTGPTTFTSTGAISLGSTIAGAFPVQTSSPVSTYLGALSAGSTPTSITTVGPARMGQDIQIAGSATIGGALQLDDGVDLTSTEGDIQVNGALQLGQTSASTNVVTGAGSVTGGLAGSGVLRKAGPATLALAGTSTGTGRVTVDAGAFAVSGSHGTLERLDLTGGTLRGAATLPDVTAAGGTIRPGSAPGVGALATGDLRLAAPVTVDVGVNGGTATALNVTGSVNLDGATLTLSGDPASIALGQPQIIVANDGTDSISETFAGLDHNSIIDVAPGVRLRIDYRGGTGNDVSLHRVLASTTQLAVGSATSSVGDGVQLTATVTGLVSTPGVVRFYRGSSLLGAVQPVGGVATLVLTSLPLGASTIEARYAGDEDVAASTSNSVTHTVGARLMPQPDLTPDPTPDPTPTQPDPVVPAADTTPPAVSVAVLASSLTAARGAVPTLRVTLACATGETSCRYALATSTDVKVGARTTRLALRSGSVTIAGGATRTVVLPLGAAARARLAKAGTLKVRLLTRVTDSLNNAATPDTRIVTIKLKR